MVLKVRTPQFMESELPLWQRCHHCSYLSEKGAEQALIKRFTKLSGFNANATVAEILAKYKKLKFWSTFSGILMSCEILSFTFNIGDIKKVIDSIDFLKVIFSPLLGLCFYSLWPVVVKFYLDIN